MIQVEIHIGVNIHEFRIFWYYFSDFISLGFIINLILAFIIIFLEKDRRSASSTWAWLFVLFLLPIVGFILYLFLGRTVSKKKLEK